jgi:hypothetical protein
MRNKNFHTNDHSYSNEILEIARISGDDFPYVVHVYGCAIYGKDQPHLSEPHFYFMDKIIDSNFKLIIQIPNEKDWESNKDLSIIPNDSSQKNWDGLITEKELLIEWMDKPDNYFSKCSNYVLLKFEWKVLNNENKYVQQSIT